MPADQALGTLTSSAISQLLVVSDSTLSQSHIHPSGPMLRQNRVPIPEAARTLPFSLLSCVCVLSEGEAAEPESKFSVDQDRFLGDVPAVASKGIC